MARTLSKNPGRDMSRLKRFARNHLGVIHSDDMKNAGEYSDKHLDLLDKYYDSEQYDALQDWEEAQKQEVYVPIRDRKPRIIYGLPKLIVDKVAAKLTGAQTFPSFIIEDDDDDTAFFKTVQKAAGFRGNLIAPIKRLLSSGSVFVRYYLVNGSIQMEWANAKYCWPKFDGVGELESIEIKYVYEDRDELKANGEPTMKWYRLILSKTADILYDNPEYREGSKPTFTEVGRNEHGLGWVQGEWFVTDKDKHNPYGKGLFDCILDFIDELNYSLSQTSQAVSYGQEPQLGVNNIDEDELEALIKSSQRAWNLGREGEAAYIETDMKGVEQAEKQRDHMRNLMLDVVRVVIHDPEKMAGSAQSGTALNILNAPLVELIDELRAVIEPTLVKLLIKIGLTSLHYNAMGEDTVIETPPGYIPASLDITTQWPAIFPATIQDINIMAQAANSLAMANVVSRKSLTRWIAANTTIIDNVEEELKEIESQPPPPSPFGSFDSGGM